MNIDKLFFTLEVIVVLYWGVVGGLFLFDHNFSQDVPIVGVIQTTTVQRTRLDGM